MFPMHPFSTSWKHYKTKRFSNVYRRWRKSALGTNGLTEGLFIKSQTAKKKLKGDNGKDLLSVRSQIFHFRSSFAEKLVFVNSFQKVDFCVSLFTAKNSGIIKNSVLTRNSEAVTSKFLKIKKNLFFHAIKLHSCKEV